MAGRTYQTAIEIGAKLGGSFKAVTGNATVALDKLAKQADKLKVASASAKAFGQLSRELVGARAKLQLAALAEAKLTAAIRAGGKPTKEQTAQLKAAAKATKAATDELGRAEKASERAASALHAAGVDTAKLTSEQHRLAAALAQTERKVAGLAAVQRGHKRILGDKGIGERLFGSAKEGAFDKVGRQINGLASDAARLGGIAAGAGLGLAAFAKHAIDAGDEIGDTAEKLGIGVVALQELRFAGKKSGIDDIGELDKALGKLAVNIGKVATAKHKGGGGGFGPIEGLTVFGAGGGGDAPEQDPFKKIGLSAKRLKDLAPEQQVAQIADKIAGLKTHSEKAAAATAIFGKGGLALVPMLAKGSAEIARMSAEGHKFGGIMGKEAVEAAGKADDAMKEAEAAAAGVTHTLGAALLPVATKTLKEFSAWVVVNRETIRTWAEKIATWIETKALPAFKSAIAWFQSTGGEVVRVVSRVAEMVGGFGNLAIAVAALRLAPLAVSLVQLGSGFVSLVGGVLKYTGALNDATKASKALAATSTAGKIAGGLAGAAAGAGVGVAAGSDAASKTGAGIAGGLAGAAATMIPLVGPLLAPVIGAAVGAGAAWAIDKAGSTAGMKDADARSFAADEERRKAARAARGPGGRSGDQIVYSPQITVAGGAAAGPEVAAAVKAGSDDLLQRLKRMKDEERRNSIE